MPFPPWIQKDVSHSRKRNKASSDHSRETFCSYKLTDLEAKLLEVPKLEQRLKELMEHNT